MVFVRFRMSLSSNEGLPSGHPPIWGGSDRRDREAPMNGLRFGSMMIAGFTALFASAPSHSQKAADTLRFAMTEPIRNVVTYYFPNNELRFIGRRIFETPIELDEVQGKFVPNLAKSWRHVNDTTLEFELYEDITFHSGNKFTADDVVDLMMYLADSKSQITNKQRYQWFKSIEKLGPYKFRVEARTPYADDLMFFAFRLYQLDMKLFASYEDRSEFGRKSPSGTGPYMLKEFDSNSGATVERYERATRHGKNRAPIKTVKAVLVPDHQTKIAQLLTGNLDLIPSVQPDNAKALGANPNFQISTVDSGNFAYLGLDVLGRSGQKELTDVRVRKALMMAIDRDAIIKGLIPGSSIAVAPNVLCLDSMLACGSSSKPPAYDPATAKKLLAEAGYPNGFEIRIDNIVNLTDIGQAIAGYWRAIGVRASVAQMTTPIWTKKRGTGEMSAHVMIAPTAVWPDAGYVLDTLFGNDEMDFVKDPAILKNLEAAFTTIDLEQRRAKYTQVFDRVNELSSHMAISSVPELYAHTKDLKIDPNPLSKRAIFASDFSWR
jgi:peptide/nickel transport system substrate-binding protein